MKESGFFLGVSVMLFSVGYITDYEVSEASYIVAIVCLIFGSILFFLEDKKDDL